MHRLFRIYCVGSSRLPQADYKSAVVDKEEQEGCVWNLGLLALETKVKAGSQRSAVDNGLGPRLRPTGTGLQTDMQRSKTTELYALRLTL